MKKTLLAVALISVFTGCTRVEDGQVGIVKNFSGEVKPNVIGTGYEMTVLDSVTTINAREMLISVENVRPKDKNNILLQDLDLTISVKVVRDGMVPFYLKTGDLTASKDVGVYNLGENILKKDAQSKIGATIRKFSSAELLDDKTKAEDAFKAALQVELDSLYGKAFEVMEVKIANITVSPAVEAAIQSSALLDAEKAKNEAEKSVIKGRTEIMTAKAEAIKTASRLSGVPVTEILEQERIEVLRIAAMQQGASKIQMTEPVTK